jgi:MarR family 2-MHQ and catechol resistance regulon transcriptional repressor
MDLNERVMIFVVLASEIFMKNSSAILKKYGLTFSHYNVLKHLVACKDGCDTVSNISRHMLVTGANVTGLAKRMEKAGLIERTNDSRDERLTILKTTPMAIETLTVIRKVQEQHVAEYLRECPKEQKEEILSVLKQIVQCGRQSAISMKE